MLNTLQRKACRSEAMHCGHATYTQVTLRLMGRDLVNDEVRRLYQVLEERRHLQV
jgi:hypothetical protein